MAEVIEEQHEPEPAPVEEPKDTEPERKTINESSGDPDLDEQITLWLKWDHNKETRKEIKELKQAQEWDELRKRLLNRIQFGTAGLRARMQAGFNSMNDLIVIQTAQGISRYLLFKYPNKRDREKRGVIIGYDGRYNSKRFAQISATIFANRGIKVWLYSRMVPTPFIPFGILKLKCLAGIMVTASHNPKEDNGYKVYWTNGSQIIPPHDKEIHEMIMCQLEPRDYSWDLEFLKKTDLLEDPYQRVFEAYYRELQQNVPAKFLEINGNSCKRRFVYTAMHGVGYPFVEAAFHKAKLKTPVAVEEQKWADPEFPTVPFPNPEEGESALNMAMALADRKGISVILANDPDADRLACAQKDPETESWKVFTGNELGALLGWWALENRKELHSEWELYDCYLISSTVSSMILRSMCEVEGLNFAETLTGFKWMGNRAIELMKTGKKVLFAFEESIGYMFTTTVLDKDGVSGAVQLATMVCYLHTQGLTLIDKLKEIYDVYGYHCSNNSYYLCYDPPVVEKIFERLRNFQNKPNSYPISILNGEFRIKHIRDLTTGVDTSMPDGQAVLPVSASSQMITFTFDNGLVITLRTSGTEPKIKYYAELCAKPDEKDWEELREKCNRMVEAIVEEFLQPNLNNLIAKSD